MAQCGFPYREMQWDVSASAHCISDPDDDWVYESLVLILPPDWFLRLGLLNSRVVVGIEE